MTTAQSLVTAGQTIRHCDRILVLNRGKVVEDGTYDELIEQGGFFAELVERQRLTASE